MKTSPSRPSILVVLIAGIGDLVMASPGLRAIRNGHPDAHIHLLTSTDAMPMAKHYTMVDEVTAFPIRELRRDKKRLLEIPGMLWEWRQRRFDLAVNLFRVASLAGAIKMGLLLRASGAPRRIGHDRFGLGLFLTTKLPADTFTGRHAVEAMLETAVQAGGIPDSLGLEVSWDAQVDAKWDRFTSLPGEIVMGIHPGGDRETKRWHPERFAAVAAEVAARFPTRIVLLGGPSDTALAARIEGRLPADCAVSNLAGKVPLAELACLISRLDLLLTNDSGPMHIAAAVKTPVVALFGPSDPRMSGPYTDAERYRVIRRNVPCERPCEIKRCPRPACMDLISVAEVATACAELLCLHAGAADRPGRRQVGPTPGRVTPA